MSRFNMTLAWLCFALAVGSGIVGKADAELMVLRVYTMALGCFFVSMAIYHRIGEKP